MSDAMQRALFRLATAGFVIALALCGWVIGYAQGVPGWEVPQSIVWALTFTPAAALILVLMGVGAALTARLYPALPGGARRAHLALAIIALALPLLVWLLQPAQWPVWSPPLSGIARLLPIPSLVVAALLYWLIALRALRRPSP